ncbi:MAG: LVIVD repeat-containing protein, partial [Candidatus Dormibacteria bacterium]
AKSLVVLDISQWRAGKFSEITQFSAIASIPPADQASCPIPDDGTARCFDVRLHSISVSPDGRRTYLAHLGGGFMVADSSQVADNLPKPKITLVTPGQNHVIWDDQGAHSAVKVPGRPFVLTTEEIYGKGGVLPTAFGRATSGCPWGWARIIDISDEVNPRLISEYKLPENQKASCAGGSPTADNFASFASHNPTVLPHVALVSWHSGGLQAVALDDPTHPTQAGVYVPSPEPVIASEDPVLTSDPNNLEAVWSYPIIRNGLIYVVDIRNGVYVLRYNGAHADEVAAVKFLEGNSNLGDAGALEAGVTAAPASQVPTALPVALPQTGGSIPGAVAALVLLSGLGVGLARLKRRHLESTSTRL